MKKTTYIDAVTSAFAAMVSWRTSFFVSSMLAAALAVGLIYQSNKVHIVLMPYDLATASGNLKIDLSASNFAEANPEYVVNLALGDIGLLLNWTPESVIVQHQRFLNRLTPDLYAEQNVQLLAQAQSFQVDGVTQSFYPTETKIAGGNKVRVVGTLIRWVGEKQTLRMRVAYVVTYSKFKGFMHVSALTIEK
jgi:hypothetical protein